MIRYRQTIVAGVGVLAAGFFIECFLSQSIFNGPRFWFISAILGLVVAFVMLRKHWTSQGEYIFLASALICGSLISFTEPRSFVSWDDGIHYTRADGYSFKRYVGNEWKDLYGSRRVAYSYSLEEQSRIDASMDYQAVTKKSKNNKWHPVSLRKFYNEMAYIPSGFMLLLGRALNLPGHVIFMLGRWINVVVFSALVFLGMRKLRSGKLIMATVALFPTTLFLSANYNYDSWVIGWTLLGLGYLFGALQRPEKPISVRETIIIIGALVIGCGAKAVYFPLLFFGFLLRRTWFASAREHRHFVWMNALAITLVLMSFLLPFVVDGPGKGDRRGGEGVNSALQTEFIINHPIEYIGTLLRFLSQYLSPAWAEGYTVSYAYLGDIKGISGIIFGVLLLVFLFDRNHHDAFVTSMCAKILTFFVGMMILTLIVTALYIAFTSVASDTVAGVQYRYLIPLLFPVLFVMGRDFKIQFLNRTLLSFIVFSTMATVNLWGAWTLLVSKYY